MPHVKLASLSVPGRTGDRQEHLDAITFFTVAGQRRRSGDSTSSHFRGQSATYQKNADSSSTRSPRSWRKRSPTTKLFDHDEWFRPLTEAQEITADVLENSVTYDQQVVDPKKVRSIQIGEFLRKYVSRRLLALSEGEIATVIDSNAQGGCRGSRHVSASSSTTNG